MTYNERVEAFKKTHPDFEAKLAASGHIPLPPEIYQIIWSLDNGPEVAYFLACNHELALNLLRLQMHFACAEIGKLAAKLEEFN